MDTFDWNLTGDELHSPSECSDEGVMKPTPIFRK